MEEIIQQIKNLKMETIVEILLAIGVIIIFKIFSSIISKIVIKIFSKKGVKKQKINDIKKNPFYLPLKTIFTFIGVYIALNMLTKTLNLNDNILSIISKVIKILMILLVARAFGEGLDEENGILSKIGAKANKELDESTKKLVLKALKTAIYVLAGFMIISELGYDIGGFLTGLGIGGVVLTLAAQDTAKSFIGGVAIFIDRPFKVGDYISVGQYDGTVEEIKFRTTNIRTVDNSVLHIPNSEMSIATIKNSSEVIKRRYYTELLVELNTDLEDLQRLEQRINQILIANEFVIKDSINIYFQSITYSGIKIVVNAYVNEINYSEFLKIQEDLNYQIINTLRNSNVDLAHKTQAILIKNEP